MSPDARSFLITGSASGIGRHLTGVLARAGHTILATDVAEEALAAAARADGWDAARVATMRLDVRRPEAWEAALDRAGDVDVLLGVAGVIKPGYVHEVAPRDVDLHIDVNVKGVIFGTTAAARRMVARGRGHIVNFGSLASLTPAPGLSLYCASKFAVRGFSIAAAAELAPRGVAVSVILPDAVQTPMLELQLDHEEAALTFSGPRPLTVDEVARVVVDRVLRERPLELAIPLSRGLLARLANTLPAPMLKLAPLFAARGRKRQEEARRRR
jgi:3-oxoacyl-[acyl-carrier protein] reductase